MKSWLRHTLLLTLPLALGACTDGFPDEEMHLGLEDKVRPLAISLSPPEASPGQSVEVTLLLHAPDPAEVEITWQVALDYDQGLYETDEVERTILPLGEPVTTVQDNGLMQQTFNWVVPDSVHRVSSAIPEVLTDPVLVALAQLVIGPPAGTPPTRAGVEAWLQDQPLGGPLDAEEQALVDRFSCAVRFRATIQTDQRVVDVTRNLTVRYSARLGSDQTNSNNLATERTIIALEKDAAVSADLDDQGIARHFYNLLLGPADRVHEIPYHADWTYFLVETFTGELYDAPFEPGLVILEELEGRWYYYRHDDPASVAQFYLDDDGEEAEMYELDDSIILQPAGVGSRYTVFSVIRDTRRDWARYHLTPGLSVYSSEVLFRQP